MSSFPEFDIFEDLQQQLGRREPGRHPFQFVELFGGKPLQVLLFEPDPETFRDEFVYISRGNLLLRKQRQPDGAIIWESIATTGPAPTVR